MSPVVSFHAGFNFLGGPWDSEGEQLTASFSDCNDVFDSDTSTIGLELFDAVLVEVGKVDVEFVFAELSMEKEVSEVATRLNGHAHADFHNSGSSEVLETWLQISLWCGILSSSVKIASSIVRIEPNEVTKSMCLEYEANSCLQHRIHIAADTAEVFETLQ